jgi:hypothetical protein
MFVTVLAAIVPAARECCSREKAKAPFVWPSDVQTCAVLRYDTPTSKPHPSAVAVA